MSLPGIPTVHLQPRMTLPNTLRITRLKHNKYSLDSTKLRRKYFENREKAPWRAEARHGARITFPSRSPLRRSLLTKQLSPITSSQNRTNHNHYTADNSQDRWNLLQEN